MTCCNDLQPVPVQTMFLGCSIMDFSASMGWGSDGTSDLSVNLIEDTCPGNRILYNTCLARNQTVTHDLGFLGEPRYRRGDGTEYSNCVKENVADTLVRTAIDLVGMPVYFRYGDFEFSGIISDWTRTNAGAPQYKVKIVDPRLILGGVQLIIGDYTGAVNGVVPVINGGTGEPQTNIFNIYGYLEQFGLICPSYSQCTPGVYNTSITCPTAVDGSVFGSLVGGFGGANLNNNGMPYNNIITGFNFLANATPAINNAWSPYGRVAFFANDLTSLNGSGCGLIQPDSGGSYLANKNYYYVDLTELPPFPDNSYRISGTSTSLLDLLNQVSNDLNFDFYVELLPVIDVANNYSSNCVAKIIKIRTVARSTQPSLDKICSFIQSAPCILESSVGQELRNETLSKFLIGGKKRSIYQVAQGTNPDGGSPSGITSLDSYIGGVRTDYGQLSIDDVILPYFGLDYDGNFIVPYQVSGVWEFNAPVWTIQSELQAIHFRKSTIKISENEIRSAMKSYSDWESYAATFNTESWQTIYGSGAVSGFEEMPLIDVRAFNSVAQNKAILPHDASNPRLGKFKSDVESRFTRRQEDKEVIYNWIRGYDQYYGKKFAVRVPFTCARIDPDSLQPIISESPVNDGGWTEIASVLGLPNGGPISFGEYENLNFFRDDENKITPFVRYENAALKTVNGLDKTSYLYNYTILSGSYTTGSGPPSGIPAGSILYRDSTTEMLYVFYFDQWIAINQSCILRGSGAPTLTGNLTQDQFCPLYCDVTNGNVYVAGNSSYTSSSGVNVTAWNIQLQTDLYVKARVEESYVYHDKRSYFAPRVVVEVPDAVSYVETTPQYIAGIVEAMAAVAGGNAQLAGAQGIQSTVFTIGGDYTFLGKAPAASMISSAAIPLEHRTQTYGPWYNPTIVGRTEIINDASLVPWRYNGYTGLNLAASSLANEARVSMYRGELGSITIPGYPNIPLGAELNAINGGYYSSSQQLIENRVPTSGSVSGMDYNSVLVHSSYARYQFPSSWTGTHGPNVTDISVSVGQGGFTTTYNMRTFAPRRGFFERHRAQRLEQIAVKTNKIADLLREEDEARRRRDFFSGGGNAYRGRYHEEHDVKQKNSSLSILGGEIVMDPGGKTSRTAVASIPTDLVSHYAQMSLAPAQQKHFMSMEGLLRPITISSALTGSNPIYIFTTSGNYSFAPPSTTHNMPIIQRDLNPFSNPTGIPATLGDGMSHVAWTRNDSGHMGHDFEMVSTPDTPKNGLGIQPGRAYDNTYRPMALRGPLMVNGWGYDVYGHPVPNKNLDPAIPGLNSATGLHPTKFLPGHLQRPSTWAAAPVDLRLDRGRGVWVDSSQSIMMHVVSGQIEPNSTGYARLVTAPYLTNQSGVNIGLPKQSGVLYKLYNMGQTVWDGCRVIARPMYLYGAESTGNSPTMYIEKAWSATRIVAKITSNISNGGSASANSPSGIDGPYYPPGGSYDNLHLKLQSVSIPSGATVFAELYNQNGTGGSQWSIYASDCSGVA